jgi:hypothetical protein
MRLALQTLAVLACTGLAHAAGAPLPRDPWAPPQVRARAAAQPEAEPTRGAALQAQVERKLRAAFEAADRAGTGRITREQARAAGLGAVAEQFDRIDVQRRGSVSFEDYRRYLRSRGAHNL